MSIFDFTREPISITKPIRLIELFAGYGSQAMALKRIGAKFEHYRVVEFDKYAIASYNAVHGTDFPAIDITKIHAEDLNICDTNVFTYLLTYSFPCTDLSVAGKQAGMSKGKSDSSFYHILPVLYPKKNQCRLTNIGSCKTFLRGMFCQEGMLHTCLYIA